MDIPLNIYNNIKICSGLELCFVFFKQNSGPVHKNAFFDYIDYLQTQKLLFKWVANSWTKLRGLFGYHRSELQ